MTLKKIISPSLSPNTEAQDVREAIGVLFNPAIWQKGSAIDNVETWFNGESFDSGRTALYALLKAFGIGRGDEVIIQAFTCVALPDSIRSAGAVPVYVDIDDHFNINPDDLEKKITKQSQAIIIQHTFGVPAQTDAILSIAKKHKIIVIEDCAHALGATYKGRKIGTLADAAFFSFGRDKIISSVWGGMATINAKCQIPNVKRKLKEFHNTLSYPSRGWIVQQLLHPIAFSLILPTYNVILGKVILEAMKQMKLLSLPNPPSVYPRRYPNALARLLIKQLAKLDRFNSQRRRIASYYHHTLGSGPFDKGATYLRYPLLVDDPAMTIRRAKQNGILLGNWYHTIIDPKGIHMHNAGYKQGSCKEAEKAAAHIVNLPTLIKHSEAKKVVYAI